MSAKLRTSKYAKPKKFTIFNNSQIEIRREEVEMDELHTRECIYTIHPFQGQANKRTESKETCMDTWLPSIRQVFNEVLSPSVVLPDFKLMDKLDAIRELGLVLNIDDYDMNLLTYWILETLVSILKESQLSNMFLDSQKMSVIWVTFVLKQIASYGYTRSELFRLLEKLFIKAKIHVENIGPIPNPYDLLEKCMDHESSVGSIQKDGKKSRITFVAIKRSKKKDNALSTSQQTKLDMERKQRDNDFFLLIDQIYFIFGNRFKYEVIYDSFYIPEPIEVITICENIQKPKDPHSTKRLSVKKENNVSGLMTSAKKFKLKWDVFQRASKNVKKDLILNYLKSISEIQKESQMEEELEEEDQLALLPLNAAVDSRFFRNLKWKAESDTPYCNKALQFTRSTSVFKQLEPHAKLIRCHSF